jgi:DNA-binding XRE family transcriptional regulator
LREKFPYFLLTNIYQWYIIKTMTGEELIKWRKWHGLTQKELADLLGVRNMTIYRWECGMRTISPYLHLALETLENRIQKGGINGRQS